MKKRRITLTALLFFIAGGLFAQDGKYGATPEDSIYCVTNVSLYREFFKQRNYNDAIKPWREAIFTCPKATKFAYVDGITLVRLMINEAKDAEHREGLIDTLMMVYDMRIEHFGERGFVLGRKGVDLMRYRPDNTDEAFLYLNESIDLLEKEAEANSISLLMQAAAQSIMSNKLDTSVIFDTFDKCAAIVEYNEKNATKEEDKEKWASVMGNLEVLFEPFASCENLVPMYNKNFDAKPDDIEAMKKMLNMLDRKGCTREPIYLKVAEALYALEPSADAAYSIAKLYLAKEEYRNATKFYEEAIEKEGDNDRKARLYYELGLIAYSRLNSPSQARSHAQRAISLRSNFGEPYLLIADIIAGTRECGDNAVEHKSVFWLATDYCNRAKNADPSVSADANRRIAIYRANFPNQEDAFFHSIVEGQTITVKCFGETTTVRF